MKKKKRERRLDFERQVADNLRAGMPLEEARRGVRRTRWLETVLQDLRFSLRLLRRSPSFSVVAVACLALGIGANAEIFSVTDAPVLPLLPVENPEQLVLSGDELPWA